MSGVSSIETLLRVRPDPHVAENGALGPCGRSSDRSLLMSFDPKRVRGKAPGLEAHVSLGERRALAARTWSKSMGPWRGRHQLLSGSKDHLEPRVVVFVHALQAFDLLRQAYGRQGQLPGQVWSPILPVSLWPVACV